MFKIKTNREEEKNSIHSILNTFTQLSLPSIGLRLIGFLFYSRQIEVEVEPQR